jgi:hypothetical protein
MKLIKSRVDFHFIAGKYLFEKIIYEQIGER